MRDRSFSELDLVGVLWRHKLWLLVCVVFAATTGYGLSQLLPPRYTAEARVFLSSSTPFDPLGQRASGNQQRYVVQQAELMSSGAVLDRVALPLATPRPDLSKAISIAPSGDSDLVIVTAIAKDPELAAALADGVAEAFQKFTAELVAEEAERAVAAVTDPAQAQQIRAAAAVYGDGVSVVDRADVPSAPSEPSPMRNAVLLAVVAALVYTVVALLPETRGRATDDDDEDDDDEQGDEQGGQQTSTQLSADATDAARARREAAPASTAPPGSRVPVGVGSASAASADAASDKPSADAASHQAAMTSTDAPSRAD